MTRICLTMIVKDEAHVIERCLLSARDWVDYWVIVDTGSTDGTQDIIRSVMEDVPGELVESLWVDFAHNRQEVWDYACMSENGREGDYAVWIDADEVFTHQPERGSLDLTDDGYNIPVRYDGLVYARLAFTNLAKDWRWVGPVHEYLELDGVVSGNLLTPGVLVRHDGARASDPDTYRKDATLISKALTGDPDNARLRFYLAQSLRDAGEPQAALVAYLRRAEMGGWEQEVYYSLYQIARLTEQMGLPATDAYHAAYNSCPWRAETMVELARIERERGRFALGLLYARRAVECGLPGPEGLFVEEAAYTWRGWDELAVNAWHAGERELAQTAAKFALDQSPTDPRLIENVRQCGV